ncbi:MAG: hypothetical protein MMC33_009244 [Icmadophila ericetorum]|nr:hypothetical protein [Icmadophila ericetorum]
MEVAHEYVGPMSPALINPDLILPHHQRGTSTVPSELDPYDLDPDRAQRAIPFLQQTSDVELPTPNKRPLMYSTASFRPSLPGAWQTEEDLHAAIARSKTQSPGLQSSPTLRPQPEIEDKSRKAPENAKVTKRIRLGDEDAKVKAPTKPFASPPEELDLSEIGSDPGRAVSTIMEEDEDDPTSHAALSLRAETILANAKKRLLEMEDNLSRARQSLGTRSASSLAQSREQTPDRSPSFTDRNNRDRWKLNLGKQRQASTPKLSGNAVGHLRMSSDTMLPEKKEFNRSFPRSSSATAASRTLDFQEQDNGERLSPLGRSIGPGDSRRRFLDPLHEDEPLDTAEMSPLRELSPFTDDSPPPIKPNRTSSQKSYFDYKKPGQNELTRSRSTIQLRDLREQMQDLKGKITSLKQRTREDSLQRRSLQTLKTPSPFTVAPGYEDEEEQKKASGKEDDMLTEVTPTRAAETAEAEDHLDGSDGSPERSDISEALLRSNSNKEYYALEYLQQTHTTNISSHAANDNLDTPLESPDEPYSPDPDEPFITGTRHEDRPDAFDYEHFFLHSGIGALQRSDLQRRDTMSSSDSAETTKPSATTGEADESSVSSVSSPDETSPVKSSSPRNLKEPPPSNQNPTFQKNSNYMQTHFHHGSIDSISTVGTFATATENHHNNDLLNPNGIRSQSSASSRSKSPNHFHSASVSPIMPSQAQYQHPPFTAMHQNTSPTTYQQNSTSSNAYGVSNSFQQPPPPATNYFQQPLSPLQSHPPAGGVIGHFRNPSVPTTPAVIIPTLPQLPLTDQRLVQDLLHSLTKACAHLNLETGEDEGSENRRKTWKRRIDAARRILESGEGADV